MVTLPGFFPCGREGLATALIDTVIMLARFSANMYFWVFFSFFYTLTLVLSNHITYDNQL